MSLENTPIRRPIPALQDRVVITETWSRDGLFSFKSVWEDDRATVVAEGSDVASTKEDALEIATRAINDALQPLLPGRMHQR